MASDTTSPPEPVAEDVPSSSSFVKSHPLEKGGSREQWRLENMPEQRVLETGLTALQTKLPPDSPPSPSGKRGSMVLRASFFERLLGGAVELKACPPSDVAAAQGDLKKLTLNQLLSLRIITQGFPTTSVGAFTVHSNFLGALSAELLQKLGARALGDSAESATRRRLETVGSRLIQCLGASELLDAGESRPPVRWLTALEEEWPGSGFVLTDLSALQAQTLQGASADFEHFPNGTSIAVVMDLGFGSAMHWEVMAMQTGKDDLPGALTALTALRARRLQRNRVVEVAQEASAALPAVPFAAALTLPKAKEASASSAKKVDWPAPTPTNRPSGADDKPGLHDDFPFLSELFVYFGCCARRRDESQ